MGPRNACRGTPLFFHQLPMVNLPKMHSCPIERVSDPFIPRSALVLRDLHSQGPADQSGLAFSQESFWTPTPTHTHLFFASCL